jgi:hypothetical protein
MPLVFFIFDLSISIDSAYVPKRLLIGPMSASFFWNSLSDRPNSFVCNTC